MLRLFKTSSRLYLLTQLSSRKKYRFIYIGIIYIYIYISRVFNEHFTNLNISINTYGTSLPCSLMIALRWSLLAPIPSKRRYIFCFISILNTFGSPNTNPQMKAAIMYLPWPSMRDRLEPWLYYMGESESYLCKSPI